MKLTDNQLLILQADLRTLAGIEYDEVMTELLDHYASLTEQKMARGMAFEDATKWAWAELGSGVGIQQIQTDYERGIRRLIWKRHLAILKSYFGWPTAVATLLGAVLIYLVTPLVSAKAMLTALYVFGLAPGLILFYGYRKQLDQHTDQRKLVWAYLTKSSSMLFNLVYVFGLNTLNTSTDSKSAIWLFQAHSTVGVVLCWLALLYSISFVQLFKENFDLRMTKLLTR